MAEIFIDFETAFNMLCEMAQNNSNFVIYDKDGNIVTDLKNAHHILFNEAVKYASNKLYKTSAMIVFASKTTQRYKASIYSFSVESCDELICQAHMDFLTESTVKMYFNDANKLATKTIHDFETKQTEKLLNAINVL